MKRFIINCVIFGLIVIVLIGILNQNYYPSKAAGNSGYMSVMIDKHRFADSVKSPRIIFCGGSNLSFGINSPQIEAHTGLPVVNLGLNGALGLDFMLNETKAIARPSDIVIISSEYNLNIDGSYRMKKMSERLYPPAKNYFNPTFRQLLSDYFIEDLQNNLPATISKLLRVKEKPLELNVYMRAAYNANGDVVKYFEPNPSHEFLHNFTLDYSYYPGIKLLNDFKNYADKNNIQVYFMYPSFPASLYQAKVKVINKIANDYMHDLLIRILNKPTDAVFADSLFYNTEYHLNPQGRDLRTKRVIKLLDDNKIGAFK